MDLTSQNYKTILPKELLKKAGKNNVRECDETEKGHFVAYVDEGDKSFDVSITILPNHDIAAHSCDCKNNNRICVHKAALLMHVVEQKSSKSSSRFKTKAGKFQPVLEAADVHQLKEWLRGILEKNKDFELSFLNYFSANNHEYTPEEVKKRTLEAVKAVAGTKKELDSTQWKKVIELWKEIHKPVLENYLAEPTNEKAFLNFHAVFDSCTEFQSRIAGSMVRIQNYLNTLLQKTTESLHIIQDDDAWSTATGYYVDHITGSDNDGEKLIRIPYLLHLKNLIDIGSEERRNKLIDRLAKQYSNEVEDYNVNSNQYTKIVFYLLKQYGLFNKYYKKFKPIYYDNEFNQKLIQQLIANGHYDLGEKYCQQQIKNNAKREYDITYLELLKEIYTIQKDEANLSRILSELLPYTFDFDDFMYIFNRMPVEEERKKWRNKIFTKARDAARNHHPAAIQFRFKLLDYERKYSKMIECIDQSTPISIILTYFDPMVRIDQSGFLEKILKKGNRSGWSLEIEDIENDEKLFPELLSKLLTHYGEQVIILAVKQIEKNRFYYGGNHFVAFIKETLQVKPER